VSRGVRLSLGLAALLLVAAALSLVVGRGGVLLLPGFAPGDADELEIALKILWEIRLPRMLLGLAVGATLGLTGAALQGLLRNPLAEPGLLGVGSGAAFGAVLIFYFGAAAGGTLALPLAGVAGALATLAVLYALAGRDPSVMSLILAGVALNAFFAALTSLALSLAPSPFAALEIVFWMMGSLADRSFDHLALAGPLMVLGVVLIVLAQRLLDALTLGEDTAGSLGLNVALGKAQIVAGTALAVGAAVSVSGVIGFVGLVVPHILRPYTGGQPSELLLPSALGGAVLLTVADILTRLLAPGPEIQIGVVTAMLGAPFFLHLLLRLRRERI
jgi:iron complex transport system permease protein